MAARIARAACAVSDGFGFAGNSTTTFDVFSWLQVTNFDVSLLHSAPNGPDHLDIGIFVLCLHGQLFRSNVRFRMPTNPIIANNFSALPLSKIPLYSCVSITLPVHLKSNLVIHGDPVAATAKNIRKREIAIDQLMTHVSDFIGAKIPAINGFIIGGDFNTNHDQPMFAAEKTLETLGTGALRSVFEEVPFEQRITHPGSNGFPDATFDYFFGKNVLMGKPLITQTKVSDHLPVTCDVTIQ